MNRFAPALPFLAVWLGLHVLGSAWASFVFYHLGILAFFFHARRFRPARGLVQGWDPVLALGAIGFGAAAGVFLWLLWPYLGPDLAPLAGSARGLNAHLSEMGLHGASRHAFLFYHAAVNPWFEEWFWRGYLGTARTRPVGNDLLFAGYHLLVLSRFLPWPWVIVSFFSMAGAAWIWRMLARRSGGLLIPVLSHGAADGAILLVVGLRSN